MTLICYNCAYFVIALWYCIKPKLWQLLFFPPPDKLAPRFASSASTASSARLKLSGSYNAQFAHDYRLLCFQMYFHTRKGTMEPTKSHKVALINHSAILHLSRSIGVNGYVRNRFCAASRGKGVKVTRVIPQFGTSVSGKGTVGLVR